MKKPLPQSVVYRKLSDDELMHRCVRRQDRQAALQLHARYGHLIFGLCLAASGDTAVAEQAARAVFFRLLREGSQFRTDSFKTWLYGIIREGAAGGSSLPATLVLDTDAAGIDYTAEEDRFRATIAAAFQKLPADVQTAVAGFYRLGKTHEALASDSGTTPAEIRNRIIAGRLALRASMASASAVSAPSQTVEDVRELLHLLEDSRCLSKRQVLQYAAATLVPEEKHAVEHHLHACPLCRHAVDAVVAGGPQASEALARHSDAFLNEHHRKTAPQVHMSSMVSLPTEKQRRKGPSVWRMAAVAAGVLVGLGLLWHFESRPRTTAPTGMQDQPDASQAAALPAPAKPAVKAAEPLVKSAVSHTPAKPAKQRPTKAPLPQLTEEGRPVPGTQPDAAPASALETKPAPQESRPAAPEASGQ